MRITIRERFVQSFAVLLALTLIGGPVRSEECKPLPSETLKAPFVFLIKPGSSEWLALSPSEARAACEIPEEILPKLDTDALVETCMNYPFLILVGAYTSEEDGLREVVTFNGFQHLSSRKDAPRALLDWYRRKTQELATGPDPASLYTRFMFLHVYLLNEATLRKFEATEKSQLALECLRLARATRQREGVQGAVEAGGAILFRHLLARERVRLHSSRGSFDASSFSQLFAEGTDLCDKIQLIAEQVLP